MLTRRVIGIALLLVFLSACAGSREAADSVEEADELPVPAVVISDYEDFDPTPYQETPVDPVAMLEHDVPASLMEGRADEGITTEVQGFRIQLHSSLDKNMAVAAEEQLRTWLQSEDAPPALTDSDPAIYNVYLQPYYRVRVGNFRSRQAAERVRQLLARQYPDAFVVPDTVVITR